MDPLSFLTKMIGKTARVGAGIALGAAAIFIMHRQNVEPFNNIDATTYGIIMVAGVVGAGTIVVKLIIACARGFARLFEIAKAHASIRAEKKTRRVTALKNLKIPRPEFIETLRYLKSLDLKRFAAEPPYKNDLLFAMHKSFLIEIDDPNYSPISEIDTYYQVPNYVWAWIERNEPVFANIRLPSRAPWLAQHDSWRV